MDSAGTFGPSKNHPWGCRAAFWSGFRPEWGRRTCAINETARDYTVTERSFENMDIRERSSIPTFLKTKTNLNKVVELESRNAETLCFVEMSLGQDFL